MRQLWEKIKKVTAGWKLSKAKWMQRLWIKKGIVLDNAGKHQEAIVCYDTTLAIDPKHPMAWSFKGSALLKLGRYQQAREAFQNFIKFAPPEYAKYVSETKEIIRGIETIVGKSKKVNNQLVRHKKRFDDKNDRFS